MNTPMTNLYMLLADALRYPYPGLLARIEEGQQALQPGPEKQRLGDFIAQVRKCSQGEWEELYTRTLDLNPPAAPYVGFQTWGESYQRGTFLSLMNHALLEAGTDTDGELPDHLAPLLRYLARVKEPLPELLAVLDPAIQRIIAGLRQADAANPYLSLLEAIQGACKRIQKEPV